MFKGKLFKRPKSRRLLLATAVSLAALLATASGASATQSLWQLADGSAQKIQNNGVAGLQFGKPDNTRLLYTDKDVSLLGNDLGKTVAASYTIAGVTGAFTYYGEGTLSNPCGTPASIRVYFESIPPGTKFAPTNYWWADVAGSAVLANGAAQTLTINVNSGLPWSDYNGQPSSANSGAFTAAASNVTAIGLSFGGGCFFENGVGTSDGSGTLSLDTFTVR